ncbi:MAG: cupin domain-containing protein [Halobacteriota archaeon]
MEYSVVRSDDVDRVDMDEMTDGLIQPDVRRIQAELDADDVVANLWYFDEDEAIVHHEHERQEEVYLVVEGEFEVKFGAAGDTDVERVEEGDVFRAAAGVPHGHKCLSQRGVIFAVGAPNVTDVNPETYTPYDEA